MTANDPSHPFRRPDWLGPAMLFNVVALSLTLACCVTIGTFVFNERRYDRHHEHAREGRLYRLTFRQIETRGTDIRGALTPPQLGPTLAAGFPDLVEAVARCRRKDTDIHYGSPIVQSPRLARSEPRFYWADPTVFDVFTIRFIAGEPRTALVNADTVVLTESMARAYFGDDDPLGRTLTVDHDSQYIVTGVVEDPPANTHLHMDFMASMASEDDSRATYWIKNNYLTYVVLAPGVTPERLQVAIDDVVGAYFDADLRKWLGFSLEDMARNGNRLWFYPHPIGDIHLTPHDFEAERYGNASLVRLLSVGCASLALVALLNFAGVAGARLKERPLRTRDLFVYGSVCGVVVPALALPLAWALLPLAEALRSDGSALPLWDPWWLVPAAVVFVALTPVAAAAVALALWRLPARGARGLGAGWAALNTAAAAAVLLAAVAIGRQAHYMSVKPLGMTRDPIIVLKEMDTLGDRMRAFKQDLRESPAIAAVSDSSTIPGRQFRGKSHSLHPDAKASDFLTLWQVTTDESFADAYGLRVKEGRFFSPGEIHGAVINETAARMLGLELGTTIFEHAPGTPYTFTVIGILEDFHVSSMRSAIPPVTLKLLQYQPKRVGRFVAVRAKAGQIDTALAHVEAVWRKHLPERSVEWMFFGDDYGRLLAPDLATADLTGAFAVLALFCMCWALSAVALSDARGNDAVGARRLAVTALVAATAGMPIGYVLVRSALAAFAYRVGFEPWVPIVTAATVVGIASLIGRKRGVPTAARDLMAKPDWSDARG